jgi:hypothetical protein
VLGHDDKAGGARTCLSGARCVLPVQEVVEAGLMGRVRRGAGVSKLLEVEDAGRP